MSKFHGEAFQDMGKGIDGEGVKKTLTWDPAIADIVGLLNQVVIEGIDRPDVVVEIQVVGGVKLDVVTSALIEFERKYHYLSQPSRIRESSRSVLGIKAVVEGLVDSGINNVVDFSGRMGISSAIIKALLEPENHYINDAEASWMPHLKKNFPDATLANQPFFDSFKTAPRSDLALVDYCSFIPARDFHTVVPALDKGHKYIILTDASPFMWHLNRNAYTRGMFVAPEKHDDFIRKFSDYLGGNYNYRIVRTIRRNTICTHLLEKGWGKYESTPERFADLYKPADKGFTIHIKLKDLR